MDLTKYLPSDLINFAVSVNAQPLSFAGLNLDQSERITLLSVAMMLEGGAKVIRPSLEICEMLMDIELNIGAEEYAQPYKGLGIILPGSLCGTTNDRIATIVWNPEYSCIITFFGDPHCNDNGVTEAIHLNINPAQGMTIEEYLSSDLMVKQLGPVELDRLIKVIPLTRIVINLCLFAVERGFRINSLDDRAAKRRRKSVRDDRMARLAARDAQEIIIQDLDLVLRDTRLSTGGGEASGLWRQRMHRRRGHWKMQAYGPGRSLRKRIFVQSYMVHIEDNPEGEVQTILS